MMVNNLMLNPSKVLLKQFSQSILHTSIPRQPYNVQSVVDKQLWVTRRGLHFSGGCTSNRNLTQILVKSHPPLLTISPGVSNGSRNCIIKKTTIWDYQVSQRFFRTTPPNKVPPPVIIFLSRIAKFGAALAGRSFRKWWANLPPEQKATYTQRLKRNLKYFYAFLGAAGFGIFIYHETHLEKTPITNRKRFVAFSQDQFDEIAKLEFKSMLAVYKDQIVPASLRDPAYRRVSKVAHRLLNANKDFEQIKRNDWTITLVNDDSIQNAFVLPCGNIFVFTGMLTICEYDDELAVILAHEMAHAVLSHGAENASYLHLVDLLLVFPVAILWAVLPTDLTAAFMHFVGDALQSILFHLPYARDMEREADYVGLLLAAKACFDIRVAPIFWAKMALVNEKDGFPQVEFLSTHPTHESRQAQIEDLLNEALSVREKCQCPSLPFMDPKKRLAEFKQKVDLNSNFDDVAIRLRVM